MCPDFKPRGIRVEVLGRERFEDKVFVVFQNGSFAPNELWEKQGRQLGLEFKLG